MSRPFFLSASAGLLFLLAHPSLLPAQQPGAADAKLRETLRATMLQLRTAEGERVALQATRAENEETIKTLTAQVETLSKQNAADKAASEKSITTLTTRIAGMEAELLQARGTLEKLQGDLKKALALAAAREAERAKLAARVIVLDRTVADQRAKNLALYKTGSEILTRYEQFGLGQAIVAREPFTGITRVKLQNLIQEYGDKLADQKIR
ncbi:MAG: phage major capsid protein [Verrucomicrobiota bacterium]